MKRRMIKTLALFLIAFPLAGSAIEGVANAALIHRWSFNGSLEDSAGDSAATIVGSVTIDGGQCKLPGGYSGSAYVDLGDNLVPTESKAVTLEFWATRETGSYYYDRIYDFGSMPQGYDFLSGNTSCYSTDNIRMFWNGETDFNLGTVLTCGTQYHIAAVFEETTNGKWQVHYYVQPASGGTISKVTRDMENGWSFASVGQREWLLGQALTCWDYCAKASYDEVRIWAHALSEDEFAENTMAGADADLSQKPEMPVVKPDGEYVETVDGLEWAYVVSGGLAEIDFSAIPSSTVGAVSIPPSLGGCPVTSIANFAFENCRRLTSVTIPKSVTSMGSYAFYGCTALTDIIFKGAVPYGVDGFDNNRVTLHVQEGAEGWDDYYDDIYYVSGQGWRNRWHVVRHFDGADEPEMTMGGDCGWAASGSAGYRSGTLSDNQSSEMSMTLNGSGTLTFEWQVSSEEHYDFLSVYVDGRLVERISGEVSKWQKVSIPVATDKKKHLVMWSYRKDCFGTAGADCGFVRNISFGEGRSSFEYVEDNDFDEGGCFYRSKGIEDGESVEQSLTVTGSKELSVLWRVSSEEGHDFLQVYVDGGLVKQISGEKDWEWCSLEFPDTKTHLVTWKYVKDDAGSSGEDCGFLDGYFDISSWSDGEYMKGVVAWTNGGEAPSAGSSSWQYYGTVVVPGANEWDVGTSATAFRSGKLADGDNQFSLLPMTVSGAGTLSFKWKRNENNGMLKLLVDNEEVKTCPYVYNYDGGESWDSVMYKITKPGTHQIIWRYSGSYWGDPSEYGVVCDVAWSGKQHPWVSCFGAEEEGGQGLSGDEPDDASTEYTWQTSVNADGTLTITGVSPEPAGVVVLPTTVNGIKVTAIEKPESDYTQWGVLSQGWDSKITDLVVPEGYVKIGRRAFSYCANLKSVSLPSSLVEIGNDAFYECSSLSSITFPSSLRKIGASAFYGTDMTHLKIPEGVTEIGTEAFAFNQYNATGGRLCEVLLPSTLRTLGDVLEYRETDYSQNPFAGCADGCRFVFPRGNAAYAVLNGQIVSKDGAIVSGSVCDGIVEIPEQAKVIACLAYALQPSLKQIVIPSTVKTLCYQAFYNSGLEEVVMQDGGVEVVNGGAFEYCSHLSKVVLPSGLKQIDGYFCGYTPVVSLEIPASVKELYNTFYEMTNLNEVVFLGDAPQENDGGFIQFYDVPKSAHFKVRLGSRGWDGDPYSAEMPTSGLWPGSYGDYGRPISTYGDRPDKWDNGWWTTLDHTMSDDGWTLKDGVWQSVPWKSATYSSDVHTNYVEFTFDEPGVFSCELKLKGQSQNAYAYVVVDGTDMESINATGGSYSGNPTWRHVEYAVDEVGSHTIRVEYRIKNNYYGTEAIAYLQNVSWTPKSAWSRPDYVWTTADNGDGTVTITDVSPRPQYDVEIPAQIGGKRVVGVGDGAEGYGNEKLFYGNTLITSITIPDGVVSIGDNCFSGCYCLKHIFIPSTLTELGKSFASCYSLVGIDIPNGVTEVKGSTFYSCRSLASVILPASVEYIGSYAFEYCYSLSRVTFCGNCPRFGGSVSYIFPQGCVMTVTRGTTGWGDGDIPGVWSGFPIEYVKFTIPQALNNDTLTFVNDACIPWESTFDVSHDGVASVRSGVTGNGQATRIMAAVEGAGTLSFWWKVDSETFEYHGKTYLADMAAFTYDGNRLEFGGCEDWTFVTMKLTAGKHELMWSFEKDDEDDASWSGEDCIWLDEVTWTPDAVALTLDDLAKVFGEDSDVVKNIKDVAELATFNDFLKNCSIYSASDLKPAQKQYAYQSFKLDAITTTPQLFEEEPVLKIDDLELSAEEMSFTISLTAGSEAIELAKDKLAQKIRVGTSLDSIVDPPEINARPSADGTSLTFTISKPVGNQGFVKVQID